MMNWRISALNEKSIKPREEAIEKIENYIVKNALQAEDRLPSERTMCELWNCNRSTLRKAIKQLILEGRIYNKNGSGTYVAPTKLMRNLQDARGFQQTAELAGRQVSTKVLEVRLTEVTKSLGKIMKLPLGHKLWLLKRVRYLDDIPVVISTVYLNAEFFPNLNQYDFSKNSLYYILEKEYGIYTKSGVSKLSISTCDEWEATVLETEVGKPVIYQTGISLDENERIIESFKEIIISEKVCFASELTRK